jgi:Ca-activated chloride channel family protein
MNFTFQYPEIVLLVLVPLIIYYFSPENDNSKEAVPTIYNPNLIWISKAFGRKNISGKKLSKFNFILFSVWCFLVLALMHPQKTETLKKQTTKGYDIMLVVDLSKSMLALDFADLNNNDKSNRLDVIKKVANKFIKNRKGDRLGLVLFGSSAYLQTPLTSDITSVATMLNLAEIGMAGDATAIGDALGLAIKSLIKRPEGSRVIILLTDGSNTAGALNPVESARLAKSYGIKIYSIGVGKRGAVPYPTPMGIVYAKMDIDETLLKKISEDTGGSYFNATDEQGLKDIYKKIDELEKTESETSEFIIRTQLYRIPLLFATILFIWFLIRRYNWAIMFR